MTWSESKNLQPLAAILSSPRGVLAVTAVIVSFIGLLLLFLFRAKGGPKSGKRATVKGLKQGQVKQTRSVGQRKQEASVSCSAPKRSGAPNTTHSKPLSAPKKPGKAADSSEAGKTGKTAAAPGKKADTTAAKKEPTSSGKKGPTSKQANTSSAAQTGSQSNKSGTKDDGEWITVAKKKTKSAGSKKATNEREVRPPMTRSSKRN